MQQDANKNTGSERRRHFRIEDKVFLSVRCISQVEANHFYLVNNEDVHQNLIAIENQISVALGRLNTALPSLAELLSLLNRKVNYALAEASTPNSLADRPLGEYLTVNLSASGIAFPYAEPLVDEQALALELWFPSSDWRVTVLGYVAGSSIKSTQQTEGHTKYWVRVDFRGIDSSIQELLVQHLVKRQQQLIESQLEESVS